MLTDRPMRRVSGLLLGIAAIFDVTGAIAFRMLRQALPETERRTAGRLAPGSPARRHAVPDAGAWESAAAVIESAYRETMMLAGRADHQSRADDGSRSTDAGGVTLTA
jgi:hypothetical protein